MTILQEQIPQTEIEASIIGFSVFIDVKARISNINKDFKKLFKGKGLDVFNALKANVFSTDKEIDYGAKFLERFIEIVNCAGGKFKQEGDILCIVKLPTLTNLTKHKPDDEHVTKFLKSSLLNEEDVDYSDIVKGAVVDLLNIKNKIIKLSEIVSKIADDSDQSHTPAKESIKEYNIQIKEFVKKHLNSNSLDFFIQYNSKSK